MWRQAKSMGSSFVSSGVAYVSAINSSTSMSPFSIVYRKIPYHLLDLAKLPIGEKFSSAAIAMAEQTIDVQKEVGTRLEKPNARYKAIADKEKRSSKNGS